MGLLDEVGDTVQRGAEVVGDLLDINEPKDDDDGSSNWAAWAHPEICSMLDTSVDPDQVEGIAMEWRELATASEEFAQFARDLSVIVTGGWRGESANAAIAAMVPIGDWSTQLAQAVQHTSDLMSASAGAAGQAKVTVPHAESHDWGGTLRSFGSGGPVSAFRDAVAQDDAQAEAHAQAVQIMNRMYSAPINENRAAVPAYPTLTDPTLQPPETPPGDGRVPGTGGPGPRMAVGGSPAGGGGGPAGDGGGYTPYEPSNGGGPPGPGGGVPLGTDGQAAPFQPGAGQPVGGQGAGGGGQQTGGQGGGAAGGGGVPVMPPAAMGGGAVGGAGAGGSRAGGAGGGRVGGAGGGRTGGPGGRFGGGGQAGFGPRGSGGAAGGGSGGGAGQGMAGRGGGAPFGAGGAGARGGMGGGMGAGMMGAGAGRGRGGEDTEHERPSYLIEMDDVFNDGRKVAPPVIGEDPPESDR
jgi:hypothetical protein